MWPIIHIIIYENVMREMNCFRELLIAVASANPSVTTTIDVFRLNGMVNPLGFLIHFLVQIGARSRLLVLMNFLRKHLATMRLTCILKVNEKVNKTV